MMLCVMNSKVVPSELRDSAYVLQPSKAHYHNAAMVSNGSFWLGWSYEGALAGSGKAIVSCSIAEGRLKRTYVECG
jgi:hypothetical protein